PGALFDIRAGVGATEILVYDEIGQFGVSPTAVRDQLKGAGDVLVKINSPGGDVFDGIAIHNDLVAHSGNVTVHVTGVAASAASIIAMAGKTIAIAPNAFVMLHNSWALTIGNAGDHQDTASLLTQVDGAL